MDLEMTGLDPARHVIVEIATLLTDDDLNFGTICDPSRQKEHSSDFCIFHNGRKK
ncbi:MAG: exonuclease domain-containing protein [Actinomycetota bacterium]